MKFTIKYLLAILVLGLSSNMAYFAGPGPLPDPPTGHIIGSSGGTTYCEGAGPLPDSPTGHPIHMAVTAIDNPALVRPFTKGLVRSLIRQVENLLTYSTEVVGTLLLLLSVGEWVR